MDLKRIFELNEERARLNEALRAVGPYALKLPARNAALTRMREISAEVEAIQNPQPTVTNPLDAMTLDELRELYAGMEKAATSYNPADYGLENDVLGLRPLHNRNDARHLARMTAVRDRIERLEAEEATD